jgi:intracellular multiplication protein IcmK
MMRQAILLSAFVFIFSQSAFAQNEKSFEDEFRNFRQKLEASNTTNAIAQNQDVQSPLGAASDLPASGQLPGSPEIWPQSPEELQRAMQNEAEAQRKKAEDQLFKMALERLLPLKPEQIRDTLEEFAKSREAAETPIRFPEPEQVVQTVSLDPSVAPVMVQTAPGYVTTVTILDSTGAPWPIQDISWAGKFEVTPPEDGGHIVRITPMTAHGVGNLSIRLVDLITPVTMSIRTGLEKVHYRFDARIPKPGPLASVPIIQHGGLKAVAGKDDDMIAVLDGTPATGAVKLKVEGADGRTSVWKIEDRVYLRTPLTLLSPAWDSSVSSADGMKVYTMQTSPVVLLSDQGKMVKINISEDEVTP